MDADSAQTLTKRRKREAGNWCAVVSQIPRGFGSAGIGREANTELVLDSLWNIEPTKLGVQNCRDRLRLPLTTRAETFNTRRCSLFSIGTKWLRQCYHMHKTVFQSNEIILSRLAAVPRFADARLLGVLINRTNIVERGTKMSNILNTVSNFPVSYFHFPVLHFVVVVSFSAVAMQVESLT